MINLKSASFVAIVHLHEGLTHIQSQIKPQLLSGESLTLRDSSCFLKWSHIKYITIVGLFPIVITNQRSLSLMK